MDPEVESNTENPFTQSELKEIESACKRNPAVQKLADRYALVFSDPNKELRAALAYAAKCVSTLVFNNKLDIDNDKHKALMHILKEGGNFYKSIQIAMDKSGNLTPEGEVENAALPIKKRKNPAEHYATKSEE